MKTSASIEPRLSTASGSGSDEEDVGGPLVMITSKNRQTHDHCAADDNGYSTDKEPATDESLGFVHYNIININFFFFNVD